MIDESEVLLLQRFLRPGAVLFDAGAHLGDWTKKALEVAPASSVHLFEPSPSTFDRLRAELLGHPQRAAFHFNPVALGEEDATASLHEYSNPALNTLHRRVSVEQALGLGEPRAQPVNVTTLDGYCALSSIRHIDFLKMDLEGSELFALRGARRMLSRRAIDYLQIEYGGTYRDARASLAEVFEELQAADYLLFKVEGPDLLFVPTFSSTLEDDQYALYFAVAPRLRALTLGEAPRMFDCDALFQAHAIAPRGVIHVGAHEGEELGNYAKAGCREVLFIEADPTNFARLEQRFAHTERVTCKQQLISDVQGKAAFHRTSMSQSHSMLPLKAHAAIYPSIVETDIVELDSMTLDDLLARDNIAAERFNVLAIDVQGAELAVLRGARSVLEGVSAIIAEINYAELYEGCALVPEIDDFLEPLGFERVEETCPFHPSWGDAIYVKRRRVSMTTLGSNGRFGNQLFQYFFLTLVSDRFGAEIETPPWIGEALFGLPAARRPTREYPRVAEDVGRSDLETMLARVGVRRDVDVWGYFQFHTSGLAAYKERFRALFTPRAELREHLDAALDRVLEGGRTLVVCHLRRGDFGYGRFFIAPTRWYVDELRKRWSTLESPLLFVASDELDSVLGDFSELNPITFHDLGIELEAARFFVDFYCMTRAAALMISNSTFSFAGAMLNHEGAVFLRPDPVQSKMSLFDPWDAPPLLDPQA